MAEEYRANPQAYAKQAEKTTAEAAGESMEAKEQVSVTCTSPHHDEVTKPKAMMGLRLQSFARLALLPANSPPNIVETPVNSFGMEQPQQSGYEHLKLIMTNLIFFSTTFWYKDQDGYTISGPN